MCQGRSFLADEGPVDDLPSRIFLVSCISHLASECATSVEKARRGQRLRSLPNQGCGDVSEKNVHQLEKMVVWEEDMIP